MRIHRLIWLFVVALGCESRDASPDPREGVINNAQFVQFEGGAVKMGHDGPTVMVQPFRIMRTEVTVKQFKRCVADGACSLGQPTGQEALCNVHWEGRDDFPMNCISWSGAQDFASWFKNGARLPTEAEWTFAASGGRDVPYPWGESATCDEAVTDDCGVSATVCSKPAGRTPAPQLVCDMIGNVAEFVLDDWHQGYDCDNPHVPEGLHPRVSLDKACPNGGKIPTDGSAWVESPPSEFKVAKGGSFFSLPSDARIGSRDVASRDEGSPAAGFRLVIPGRP